MRSGTRQEARASGLTESHRPVPLMRYGNPKVSPYGRADPKPPAVPRTRDGTRKAKPARAGFLEAIRRPAVAGWPTRRRPARAGRPGATSRSAPGGAATAGNPHARREGVRLSLSLMPEADGEDPHRTPPIGLRAGTGDEAMSDHQSDDRRLAHTEMLRAEIEGVDAAAKALASGLKRYAAAHRRAHGQPPSAQVLREVTDRTAAAADAKARSTAKITTEGAAAGGTPAASRAGGGTAAPPTRTDSRGTGGVRQHAGT